MKKLSFGAALASAFLFLAIAGLQAQSEYGNNLSVGGQSQQVTAEDTGAQSKPATPVLGQTVTGRQAEGAAACQPPFQCPTSGTTAVQSSGSDPCAGKKDKPADYKACEQERQGQAAVNAKLQTLQQQSANESAAGHNLDVPSPHSEAGVPMPKPKDPQSANATRNGELMGGYFGYLAMSVFGFGLGGILLAAAGGFFTGKKVWNIENPPKS